MTKGGDIRINSDRRMWLIVGRGTSCVRFYTCQKIMLTFGGISC